MVLMLLDRQADVFMAQRCDADCTEAGAWTCAVSRASTTAAGTPAPQEHHHRDEGDCRQEEADQQDQAIAALQGWSPRCRLTGGTTLAPAERRATIQKC